MSELATTPERIDLARSDDPRDVVHRAVACLAQGGVVVLPTDTSYFLAASALRPEAVARLRRIKGATGDRPLTLAVRGAEELDDWAPGVSVLGRRLARRAWPGAVALLVEDGVDRGLARRLPAAVREAVASGSVLGLRSPAHDAVQELLRLIPGPLILTGARRGDDPPAATADEAARLPDLDMILDDGRIPDVGLDTMVRISGDSWRVVRPGRVEFDVLQRMAGTLILFVCTGNTCRSPMAEAICKSLLADRLDCKAQALEGRGFVVLSAGLAAAHGQRAAAEAIETVQARGGSLRDHASRPVSPEMVVHADLIVTMTNSHRDMLLDVHPEAADRVRLLDPTGGDVDDPIGSGLDVYRRTADSIQEHLEALLDDLGI